ncbi:MAG: crcB1 [Solirubrobacterales bacterium]|nr:crcB1 [Solirubrobacterales bacterium]
MRIRRIDLIAVFAGGMAGTLARAGLGEIWPLGDGGWPWATFVVNLAGAALLGWAMVALPARGSARPFVGTGVCGALTTFSTFQLQLYDLVVGGHAGRAASYALASLAGGLVLIEVGRRWATRTAEAKP